MNVNFQSTKETPNNQIGLLTALKKRAIELMDEENFKLVLELEQVLKTTQESLVKPKKTGHRQTQFLQKCEEKIMQKKNLSCDVSHIKEELLNNHPETLKNSNKNLVISHCAELEKSMNLLRDKCETFQNSLIDKENEIFELSQENSRLRAENFEAKKELKESQEHLTKMIQLFERELKDRVNPFSDRTTSVVNASQVTDFFSPKVTALSQNTSPSNFVFVSKAKRFLKFGDENAF